MPISAEMDSVIASSCDLSMIFTAYSNPVSLETHLRTVLESPLRVCVCVCVGVCVFMHSTLCVCALLVCSYKCMNVHI